MYLDKDKCLAANEICALKYGYFCLLFVCLFFSSAFSWPSACGKVVRDLARVAGEPSIRQNPL